MNKRTVWGIVAVLAVLTGGYLVWSRAAGDAGSGGGPPWMAGGAARPPAVVTTEAVTTGDFVAESEFVGTLTAHAMAELYAKVPGQITAIHAETGDPVRAGQVLARIESDQQRKRLEQAAASLEMSRATLSQRLAALGIAEATARRTRSLAEQQLVPEQQLDQVEAELEGARAQVELARAQVSEAQAGLSAANVEIERTLVRAPFDGVVGKRHLDGGARAGANDVVFTVVDLSPIEITVPMTARDAARVVPGQVAEVTVDSLPGRTFEGRVARIASIFDPRSLTADAEIEIDNTQGLLKPGMFATVSIAFDTAAGALLVPAAAVVEDERESYVMVVEADAGAGEALAARPTAGPARPVEPGDAPSLRARRVPVEPLGRGVADRGTTAVAGELAPGQQVITLGQGSLPDGSPMTLSHPSGVGGGRPSGPGTGRPTTAPAD